VLSLEHSKLLSVISQLDFVDEGSCLSFVKLEPELFTRPYL
jgi:hypothetical protein